MSAAKGEDVWVLDTYYLMMMGAIKQLGHTLLMKYHISQSYVRVTLCTSGKILSEMFQHKWKANN